jgi:hypothetical protein
MIVEEIEKNFLESKQKIGDIIEKLRVFQIARDETDVIRKEFFLN